MHHGIITTRASAFVATGAFDTSDEVRTTWLFDDAQGVVRYSTVSFKNGQLENGEFTLAPDGRRKVYQRHLELSAKWLP